MSVEYFNVLRQKKPFTGTWEEFSEWLLDFRWSLSRSCQPPSPAFRLLRSFDEFSYPPEKWKDTDWVEQRLTQLSDLDLDWEKKGEWYTKAHQAWEALRGSRQRLQALMLLGEAVQEVQQEVYNGVQFWKSTKAERRRLGREL